MPIRLSTAWKLDEHGLISRYLLNDVLGVCERFLLDSLQNGAELIPLLQHLTLEHPN